MPKCLPQCVAGLLGERVVLDFSLPLNTTWEGVVGGVSTLPIAIGDALSDRSFAATHAFGLEAMSIGWGCCAAEFVVAIAGVVTVVASLEVGKLLLPEYLAPPSSTLVTEVE